VARIDDEVLRVTGLTQVGVYDVEVGRWRQRLAANLLAEGESRIAPRSTLTLGAGGQTQAATASLGRRELWRPLLLLALVVLLVEWLLYHRRAVA
jgi:hypothetical protein